MANRSLNKVILIGNLTRDPELRYTPQGTAVCSFGLATNRQWTTDTGEKKEDVEFHNLVSWNKLAEICSQLLKKGSKTYIEGRLSTRKWEGQDGQERQRTEVVVADMILLDRRRDGSEEELTIDDSGWESEEPEVEKGPSSSEESKAPSKGKKKEAKKKEESEEEDMPF